MRRKAEQLARKIADSLAAESWVECVTLGETAESDLLDPYFSVILDVYHHEGLPGPEKRAALYGDPTDLGNIFGETKDRFFSGEVPVHVNYLSVRTIRDFLGGDSALGWILRDTGTHLLYRMQNGQVLFSRSAWLSEAKLALLALPRAFWSGLRDNYCAKMEHFLSDLGAAVLRSDSYFYRIAFAEMLKHAVSALFAANRRFEPSHRFIATRVRELPELPENFLSRWDTLLRDEAALTPARKYEVAKLLAMSVIDLSPA